MNYVELVHLAVQVASIRIGLKTVSMIWLDWATNMMTAYMQWLRRCRIREVRETRRTYCLVLLQLNVRP